MVALVIDPSIVGTDAVASVSPHEIPAYEPPAPAVSSRVPDYERTPRAAPDAGDPADRVAGKPAATLSRAGIQPQQEERTQTPPVTGPEAEQDNDEHERSQPT